jgi:hypothetical protein
MSSVRHPEAEQTTASNLSHLANTGPSLQRAAILFAASLGSFIGASLLLASM